MDRLRQLLAQVGTHLGKLTPTQKLLLGSLGVIALMTLFLVAQYAGRRSLVDLMEADPSLETVRFLQSQGIDAEQREGRVMVPTGMQPVALAAMAESGRLPNDTTLLFDSIIEQQSWTNSREQNEQLYLIALQNELARVIGGFEGVRSAKVIIDAPKPTGIGRIVRDPTASATVFTDGGKTLSQDTIDAISHLIAGARAGLTIESVRVINGSTGTQHRASSEEQAAASNYLEHAAAVENAMRKKIQALLSYIPGAIVAVTARVDIARENVQITSYLPKGEGSATELLASESKRAVESTSGSPGAEPGLRSNATADINRGSTQGRGYTADEIDTQFENFVGQTVTQRFDPKGMPTRLAASINVPRSYVVSVITGDDPDADEPDQQRVDEEFERVRQSIIDSVSPHLGTDDAGGAGSAGDPAGAAPAGVVKVSMIRADALPMAKPEQAGMLGGTGGLLAFGGGMLETALLVILSLVSLTLMAMMVRRAGRETKLPSAEEIVGVPPVLQSDSDLIGEVDASDGALEAVEVDESRMSRDRMLEQVTEMVRQDPSQSAKLLNRWIAAED